MIGIDVKMLAICYGEREIRVWDLENEDNAAFRFDLAQKIVF